MAAPSRGRVRDVYLRLLGVIFLAAFLSLLVQVRLLLGREGLLPAATYVDAIRRLGFFAAPTVFWLDASDRALVGAAVAGAILSFGLILNVAPRWCLVALWALYVSFVNVGQEFLSFQWDNLLLEAAFFTLFVTPRGFRPKRPPEPHPIGVFLMLWLVFRMNFESGAAKLLTGDPTWRNLTAMVAYYETAPLPTWAGWYAHQAPVWAQRVSAGYTMLVELVLAPLVWGPARVRRIVFAAIAAMQAMIVLTSNYGFFNYLTLALALFVLDDRDFGRITARLGRPLLPAPPRVPSRARTALLGAVAAILVPVSVIPFLPFFRVSRFARAERALDTVRSINAYHLFAHMTLVRKEVVIEGSADGESWEPYEFRFKPGDPSRPPPFVAPHQPRVDFQLWFLLLGGPPRALYFNRLLERLLTMPATVAPLFARDPFPETPPRLIRVAFYRYRFTDAATRRATGAWWSREPLGYSRPLAAGDVRGRP